MDSIAELNHTHSCNDPISKAAARSLAEALNNRGVLKRQIRLGDVDFPKGETLRHVSACRQDTETGLLLELLESPLPLDVVSLSLQFE